MLYKKNKNGKYEKFEGKNGRKMFEELKKF